MRKNPRLEQVGKHIRAMRESAGFSQEEFADKIEMDRSYYGRLERGEHSFSILKLIDIADALSREVGDLMPKLSDLRRRKKR
jgi:transcriptional regulator with XRE-family HTH domain